MNDFEDFDEIKEMKLLSEDSYDFNIDISKITENGLEKRYVRQNLKDYIKFTILSLAVLALLITVSLVNFKILIIAEMLLGITIPLSVIPISLYKVRRAKIEN